jgi:hypothetical protein
MGEQDQLKPIGFCIDPICKPTHDGYPALRTVPLHPRKDTICKVRCRNAIGKTTQGYWTKCPRISAILCRRNRRSGGTPGGTKVIENAAFGRRGMRTAGPLPYEKSGRKSRREPRRLMNQLCSAQRGPVMTDGLAGALSINGLGRLTQVFVPSCSRVLWRYPARRRGAGEEP